jgi:hypothetical protein
MKIVYLIMAIGGLILTCYGFYGIIDSRIPKQTLRSFLFLVGIICMALGILLFNVPLFFTPAP